MKKKLLASGLIFTMLASCMTGCGKSDDKKITLEITTAEEITTEEATTLEETTEEVVDYVSAYDAILGQYVDMLYMLDDDYPPLDGEYGVAEFARMVGKQEALNQVGYTTMDINGDDVPELIIGTIDSPVDPKGNIMFAVYSMVDGVPKLCIEGWYRNFYALMNDGRIYNCGSSGAAYTCFGTYHLDDRGELACENFYFTSPENSDDVYDEDYYGNIHFYYNTTGEWDVNASSLVEGDESDVYVLIESWESQVMDIDFITFDQICMNYGYNVSDFAETVVSDTVVELVPADDIYAEGGYEVWTLDDSEWMVELGIKINNTVTDFRFALLDYNDSSTYNCTYIENLGTVNEYRPLIVGVSFPGDFPRYGFSFLDVDGRMRYFAICQSGEDGSYYLSEFN